MAKVKYLLGSRKFWAAVIGLVLLVAKQFVPDLAKVDEQQVTNLVYIIVAYIVGTAIEDSAKTSR